MAAESCSPQNRRSLDLIELLLPLRNGVGVCIKIVQHAVHTQTVPSQVWLDSVQQRQSLANSTTPGVGNTGRFQRTGVIPCTRTNSTKDAILDSHDFK